MYHKDLKTWQHSHAAGQDVRRPGERRTIIVIIITAVMMVIEIVAGILYGSMALLADGLHMASHAAALGITAFAYIYARRHAHDARFSFGTGKVNALGAFSSAILLALFALMMAWESFHRLINPVDIIFNQAILVAVIGLAVNGVCAVILGTSGHDHQEHHGHDGHTHPAKHHDHNLAAAYFHVLADALTSVLAIVALLAAKYFGTVWMDPFMGVAGAVLVARWSVGLLRMSGGVLLDRQAPESVRNEIVKCIEEDGYSRVADLHLWSIGPDVYALVMSIVAHTPGTPDQYKARISTSKNIAHVSIEVHRCCTETRNSPGQDAPPGQSVDYPDSTRSDTV
jgi:cation diffusion facilitator family transporter